LEAAVVAGFVLDELAAAFVDCFDGWPAVTSIETPGLVCAFGVVVEGGFGEVDFGALVPDWVDPWPVDPTVGTQGLVSALGAVGEVGFAADVPFEGETAGDAFEALLPACSDGCPTFTSTETLGLDCDVDAVVEELPLDVFTCVGIT
jgi:hypothetical protein